MKPQRVQRKRTKGWKMPENTVSVCRPGKWGNPFKIKGEPGHWFMTEDEDHMFCFTDKEEALKCAVGLYREYIAHRHNSGHVNINDLAGKNLACFCPLDNPCHADVLLELANLPAKQEKGPAA